MSMPKNSHLANPNLTVLLFAVLVHKLGGKASVTQQDIDEVCYSTMNEFTGADGSIQFELEAREMQG